VVPVVPVPEPVVDDAVGDGLVVAFPQVIEYLLVKGGVAAGAGFLHGAVRLAQDGDDVLCPGLEAAGPRPATARHRRTTCWQHCWMPAMRSSRCW
jgi:hypothetical protein